jgi:hypothetical protein
MAARPPDIAAGATPDVALHHPFFGDSASTFGEPMSLFELHNT